MENIPLSKNLNKKGKQKAFDKNPPREHNFHISECLQQCKKESRKFLKKWETEAIGGFKLLE
jgi:endonuclease YncB( thermonuclease family)